MCGYSRLPAVHTAISKRSLTNSTNSCVRMRSATHSAHVCRRQHKACCPKRSTMLCSVRVQARGKHSNHDQGQPTVQYGRYTAPWVGPRVLYSPRSKRNPFKSRTTCKWKDTENTARGGDAESLHKRKGGLSTAAKLFAVLLLLVPSLVLALPCVVPMLHAAVAPFTSSLSRRKLRVWCVWWARVYSTLGEQARRHAVASTARL